MIYIFHLFPCAISIDNPVVSLRSRENSFLPLIFAFHVLLYLISSICLHLVYSSRSQRSYLKYFCVIKLIIFTCRIYKINLSCSVDRNKYQIHIPLPPKIDPTVTMMQVEEKPDVTYSDVGGCKEQIEKLREVVETPLLHVSGF